MFFQAPRTISFESEKEIINSSSNITLAVNTETTTAVAITRETETEGTSPEKVTKVTAEAATKL